MIWLSWTVSAEKYRMNGQLIVFHPKALHDIYVAQAFSSLWAWDWAREKQSNTSIGTTFRPPKATAICISNSWNWRKNMEKFRRMATFTGHHSWRCSQGVLPKGGKPGRAQHHLERGQNASLQGFPTNSTFQLAPCSPSVAIAVAAAWAAPAGNCLPWPKGPPASERYGFCCWDSTVGVQYRYTTLLLFSVDSCAPTPCQQKYASFEASRLVNSSVHLVFFATSAEGIAKKTQGSSVGVPISRPRCSMVENSNPGFPNRFKPTPAVRHALLSWLNLTNRNNAAANCSHSISKIQVMARLAYWDHHQPRISHDSKTVQISHILKCWAY